MKLTIYRKLMIGFGIVIFLMLIANAYVLLELHKVTGTSRTALTIDVQAIDLEKEMRTILYEEERYADRYFMARDTVKSALGSTQGLQNYLSNTTAVNSFLEKGVIKAGMANQQILNAVLSSDLAGAVLNTPAMQDVLKHPDVLNNMVAANPQIAMMLANPNILTALMNNPQTAAAAGNLNLGGMMAIPGR